MIKKFSEDFLFQNGYGIEIQEWKIFFHEGEYDISTSGDLIIPGTLGEVEGNLKISFRFPTGDPEKDFEGDWRDVEFIPSA